MVVRLRTLQLISAHTDLTKPIWTQADAPIRGGVRGAQCAWQALPVQTPPASYVHCNSCCHCAREDTDASASMGPLRPQPWFTASHSTMARACSWGRPWHKPEVVYGEERHSRPPV